MEKCNHYFILIITLLFFYSTGITQVAPNRLKSNDPRQLSLDFNISEEKEINDYEKMSNLLKDRHAKILESLKKYYAEQRDSIFKQFDEGTISIHKFKSDSEKIEKEL